jgi:asparagine synthase (glutamine-hydrolysing)
MCGLAGYIDLRRQGRVDDQVLKKMTDTQVHRGPDSRGCYWQENAGLGFCRLSIIDLETGAQPVFNEDRSLVLACNGEIYNYVELRKELVERGHSFYTNSDVEVLVHLYEEHGPNCVTRLNGQFAFAIYDTRDHSLYLARDHFGICPLHYACVDGLFAFASEIKALLAIPEMPRAVDLVGLDQVLSLPGTISPRTMFRSIESLPSGHYAIVKNGKMHITEYWDLDYPLAGEEDERKPETFYVNRLLELFEASVRYRLQADVAVGFFLSGGLDSSVIAAMIRSISPETERHSFSVRFSDSRIDESKYQRMMANAVGSIHHEITFDESQVESRLRSVVFHSECPLKEAYNTASLALSRIAKESGIKCVLNGEGSDELFAGYVGYGFDKRRAERPRKNDLETIMGNEIREKLWGDQDLCYEKDEYSFQEIKGALYSESLSRQREEFDCFNLPVINKERVRGRHPVHKRSYLDFKLRLGGHLIADHGDRMAMANSIEARYPFLDIGLVEFCRKIPADFKLNGFTEKAILKKAAKSLLPAEIVAREKFGFVAKGSPSLLQANVEWVWDMLSYEQIKRQGYFSPDTVEGLKKKYSREGYHLDPALEDDFLMVVLTFGLLQEEFALPALA